MYQFSSVHTVPQPLTGALASLGKPYPQFHHFGSPIQMTTSSDISGILIHHESCTQTGHKSSFGSNPMTALISTNSCVTPIPLQKGLLQGHAKLDCFSESKGKVAETWWVQDLDSPLTNPLAHISLEHWMIFGAPYIAQQQGELLAGVRWMKTPVWIHC